MIGAALVGGMAPAVADVTVFGHIDTSVNYVDEETRGPFHTTTNLVCNTCSIGFKGSEDLGNGLKAIFKIDFQYDITERNTGKASASRPMTTKTITIGGVSTIVTVPSTVGGIAPVTNVNDTSSITDRDQWLGLAGNFGQIRFGTISTVYKSHGSMIDPIYRTSVQARDLGLQSVLHRGAGEDGQGRATNTFRYDSPSWNGLKVGATYTMQSETDLSPSKNTPWGAGVEYKNGPFLVFADYITSDNGGDDDAYKLGGKWTFGNYALYGQYEVDGGLISNLTGNQGWNTGRTDRNKGDGADVWEIGGTGTWGNNTLVVAYGQGDRTTGNESVGNPLTRKNSYDAWEIVGVHSMSKRTLFYGGYARISPDGRDLLTGSSDADADIVTLGMKHLF